MNYLFAREAAKRTGQELMEFLLDAAPMYARSVFGQSDAAEEQLMDEFQEKYPSEHASGKPKKRPVREGVTPYKCYECQCPIVCVDTELACLVCRECGRQGPVGFEHGYLSSSDIATPRPYQYKPVAYLLKHLRRLQACDGPAISPEFRRSLSIRFDERGIQAYDITPTSMLNVLRSMKASKWYPHRWYLTRRMNPYYHPLRISHDVEEKLCAIFASCYQAFVVKTCAAGQGRKKFVSYLVFIEHVLKRLEESDLEHHFTPPKTKKAQKSQAARMSEMMSDVNLKTTH